MGTDCNYWLICLPRENYVIALQEGMIGFSARKSYVAEKIQPGDKIVFYITKESVDPKSKKVGLLSGVVEVESRAFFSERPIWVPVREDIFPHRVRFTPLDTSATAPLKPLAQDLSFVYSNLGTPLQKGYVQLKKADWQVLLTAMGLPALS